jgi:hypothetical protein
MTDALELEMKLQALVTLVSLTAITVVRGEWLVQGEVEDRGHLGGACGGGALFTKVCVGMPVPSEMGGFCDEIMKTDGRSKAGWSTGPGLANYQPSCDAATDEECLPSDWQNCMDAVDAGFRRIFSDQQSAGLCSWIAKVYSTSGPDAIGTIVTSGACVGQ